MKNQTRRAVDVTVGDSQSNLSEMTLKYAQKTLNVSHKK